MKTYGFIWGCWCIVILLTSSICFISIKDSKNKNYDGETVAAVGESIPVPLYEVAASFPKMVGNSKEEDLRAEISLKAKSAVKGNRWGLTLDQEEKELLARIMMLEAGGEPDLGQQAVAEVIFNRVRSPLFPDTVYEVLSQKTDGFYQFSSWEDREKKNAEPTQRIIDNIEVVLEGNTEILPYETVYFSISGENNQVQVVIGNHVFCN